MLNELRERGSLCSLLQRPGLAGREEKKYLSTETDHYCISSILSERILSPDTVHVAVSEQQAREFLQQAIYVYRFYFGRF